SMARLAPRHRRTRSGREFAQGRLQACHSVEHPPPYPERKSHGQGRRKNQAVDVIDDAKFGMLTRRHADGQLHSQPLTTQNKTLDESSTLYFFVPRDGEIVRHLASDANVNVAYANLDNDDYVSVSGTAALSEDVSKKEELFNTIAKAWFPGGPSDPNLVLL